MEMMEYENQGIIAEALTFTDNQSLLVKKNYWNEILKINFWFFSGTFYGETIRNSFVIRWWKSTAESKKRILFETVQAWSEIDLTPYNNSEITTLEEHIKRKWADISAETAGEQYTPDDIISLITDIIAMKKLIMLLVAFLVEKLLKQ